MVIVILLLVVIAASVATLFLRGFKISDLIEENGKVVTPGLQTWLVQTKHYPDKMTAYKTGLTQIDNGCGVYVMPDENGWTWVCGAYMTQSAALTALSEPNLPGSAICKAYEITQKEFTVEKTAAVPCANVLQSISNVLEHLLAIRTKFVDDEPIQDLRLQLTQDMNDLKSAANELQNLNGVLKNPLLATMIYSANENILALNDVIFTNETGKRFLSLINTATIKTIFSLDNF